MGSFIIVVIILVVVITFFLKKARKFDEEVEERKSTSKKKSIKEKKTAPHHTDLTFEEYNSKWDSYYGIRTDEPFTTTLSGTKYNDCQSVIKKLVKEGDELMLLPDLENEHDKTATRVCTKDGWMVGWIPNQEWSDRIFTDLLKGRRWDAYVKEIRQPSKEWNFYNVVVELWRYELGTVIDLTFLNQ